MDAHIVAEASSVLRHYPQAGLRVLGELGRSTRNYNFAAEDNSGRRYALRLYRKHIARDFIGFLLEFQCYLRTQGFPTPQIIPTRRGDLTVEIDDRTWSMSEVAEGEHLTYERLDQIAEAGRRLAEFHRVAQGFPGTPVADEVTNNTRLWWTDGQQELGRIASRYASSGLNGELKLLYDWHEQTLNSWPLERLDALPKGFVHGDWHGRNMVFVEDRIVGVFDFDDMNNGFLAEDLAYGVRMFGRENRRSLHIRSDAVKAFLAGYEEQRTMTPEERAAIGLFLTNPRQPLLTWAMMVERLGLDPVPIIKTDVARMSAFRADLPRLTGLWEKGTG